MRKKQLIAIIFVLLLTGFSGSSPASAMFAAQSDPTQSCAFGTLFSLIGLRTNAREQLENGFDALQAGAITDLTLGSRCSFFLGQLRQSIGDWDGALAAYMAARNDFRAIGDQQLEWGALFGIGSVYMSQGRMAEGTDTLNEALNLLRTSNEAWFPAGIKLLSEASTLNNLANIKSWQANQLSVDDPEAQQLFNQAQTDYETVLQMLATVNAEVSNSETAVTDTQSGEEPLDEETVMLLLQLLSEMASQSETGESDVDSASGLAERLPSDMDLENLLENPPDLSSQGTVGNLVPALSHDLQALVWNNLGETYRMQAQFTEALDSYEQALRIAAESLNQQDGLMAPTSRQFGLFNQALAWSNKGLLLYDQGDMPEALEQLTQAETAARQLSNSPFLVRVLMSMGTVQQEQGQTAEALVAFEEAMNLLDSMRLVTDSQLSQVSTDSSSQITAFALTGSLVQFTDLYQYVAGVYYQAGEFEKAFYTAERGRSRLFLNMLTAGQLQLLDETDADLLTQEREAYILRTIARDDLARAETLGLDAFTIGVMTTELEAAEAEYDAVLAAVESQDDQLAALVSGKTNVLQLADVQALLDEYTTLIIYYQLLDQARSGLDADGTLAFVVSKDEVTAVPLPGATTDNLATAVTDLHKWINHDNPYPRPLRNLYNWLVAPLESNLDTPVVGIVPHQSLHYVPFAALTDGETYFIEAHSLFTLPSASGLPLIQENVASVSNTGNGMLVFGNPETDSLPSLPDAEAEAEAVAALLGTTVYTGLEATESRFWAQAPEAHVVHLAAHGIYDEAMPLESTLYLATDQQQDGRLQVGELYHLGLNAAEMVVLSACQTNVGLVSAGDEVVGLTRAFLNAGTPSIIASLWRVDDKATEALMVAFYRYWMVDGLSKAEALQAAQAHVRMLDDGIYASPYYWAGFVLNGDGGTYTGLTPIEPAPMPPEPPTHNANGLPIILYGVAAIVVLWFIGLWVLKRFQD